jgi:hypothetical protein
MQSVARLQDTETIVPLIMKISGDNLECYIGNRATYLGFIECSLLVQLVQTFSVTLTATVEVAEPRKKATTIRELPVSMVVYGYLKDRKTVGALLADKDLALQHPRDYDNSVEYNNPHYLVRPGSRMPNINCNPSSSLTKPVKNEVLDECEKSRLLRAFDSANGLGLHCRISPSPRLRSILKELVFLESVVIGVHIFNSMVGIN